MLGVRLLNYCTGCRSRRGWGVKNERFARYLETVQPEAETAPTRCNAQSLLGRRAHASRGSSAAAPPPRNTRARSVLEESEASDSSRRASRRVDEEED